MNRPNLRFKKRVSNVNEIIRPTRIYFACYNEASSRRALRIAPTFACARRRVVACLKGSVECPLMYCHAHDAATQRHKKIPSSGSPDESNRLPIRSSLPCVQSEAGTLARQKTLIMISFIQSIIS